MIFRPESTIVTAMASALPKRSYAKTKRRREEILSAAMDVFAASGYRGGSLREIAELVGLTQAGLLHHFHSKADLLSGVLTLRDADSVALMGDVTGEATIRGYLQLIRHNEGVPGLVELYCILSAEATAPDHEAHEYFIGRYDYVLSFLDEAFGVLAADGKLKPGVDPHEASVDLVALSDGLQLQWLLRPGTLSMGDAIQRFLIDRTTLEF